MNEREEGDEELQRFSGTDGRKIFCQILELAQAAEAATGQTIDIQEVTRNNFDRGTKGGTKGRSFCPGDYYPLSKISIINWRNVE